MLGAGGAVLGSSGLLAACGGQQEQGGGEGVGNFPSTPQFEFVFVNHVTTNEFFTPTRYGAEDACAILGCKYQWTGSETSEAAEMVNAMNAAISRGVDGIAVSLVDTKAFNGPTEQALAKGIPVVAYNADVDNARLGYIGQDLYTSGYEMGKRIVDLVGEGKVALFIATPGQLNIQPRIDGAVDAIKESGAPIDAKEIATGAEVPEELRRIESWYLGNKDVKGMFAVDAGSTQGVGQVMDKYGLHDKGVRGGGYDLLPKTLELIQKGSLDFTIDQEPYQQGFLPVLYLWMYHLSGGLLVPPETNTGLVFITRETVGPFLRTESRYEGSTGEQKYIKG
ncbi:MAG: substrate-binding domain-containing protein [Streptosporangiales bacterium]|nr:substrate-binding domain-containing protein [Streptosporangiales bacterium]